MGTVTVSPPYRPKPYRPRVIVVGRTPEETYRLTWERDLRKIAAKSSDSTCIQHPDVVEYSQSRQP